MPFSILFMRRRAIRLMSLDPSATEIITAMAMAGWVIGALFGSIWLGLGMGDWASYELVAKAMPEWAWVTLFAVTAGLQALGVLADDRWLRQTGAVLACFSLFWLGVLILQAVIWHPVAWVYLTLGVANAWAWVQIPKHTSG
ncbi:hypothetical protein [Thioalkalivibrio sp. ARh3]|uniref:hypothetical protein n=1 Tax=Thioalkalivibrio sp. ARh3 TaxID=1158148 RepID=UPI0003662EB7|nr:hypothetical protein [Thioalkalivibrio sp. ARh3]